MNNRYARYALAGLETGVTGAIVMLAWFAIASLWSRRTVWWIPNLTASVFYGERSLSAKAGGYSIVGIAMILFAYGVVGLLFGMLVKEQPASLRLMCFGVVTALGVHYLIQWAFWKGANPVAHMYAPDSQILLAHILFGCVLARYARVRNRLAVHYADTRSV
jgi:hypothetical protein